MRADARWLAGVLLVAACSRADANAPSIEREPPPLVVARGPLEQHLLLTGAVDASVSLQLQAPRTEDWQITIRWLAEDGAQVKAGDRLVEFDNVAVVDRIRELQLEVAEAATSTIEQRAKNDVAVADKAFEVLKQKAAVAKAELDARVPAHLLSRREAQNFLLALSRAEVALATAIGELRAAEKGGAFETDVKEIAAAKSERKLESAETELGGLSVAAPRDGLVVIGDHPWEGRKLQVGDMAWPGMTVAKLPDFSEMVVRAKLSDVDDGRVQVGMPVACVVDAAPDTPLSGFVAAVNPVAQESAQQTTRRFFDVLIELEQTSAAVLRPGLSVQVDVVTRRVDDAILAPRAALDLATDPPRARLADGRDVEIEIDFCDAQACAIASGLAEGDALRGEDGP
ncbi:MAG TPA: HlyD family efflux transporter periplasmic adaptor subunit [Nannocystaceae bacterium]|nr:HlyD family efflux transporter periplasmic adaptor subunit [Nannocystaceae bacterium]